MGSLISELLFGNGSAYIPTYGRNDNACDVFQVRAIISITYEKRLNWFLESNVEVSYLNDAAIMGFTPHHVNTSDVLSKSAPGGIRNSIKFPDCG